MPPTHGGRDFRSAQPSALAVGIPVVAVVFVVLDVVPLVVFVEFLVVLGVLGDVSERARTFGEKTVVVPLLELSCLAEPARTSFSGHVFTCLECVPSMMPHEGV